MPKIIVQANPSDQNGRVTLTERVIAAQLIDTHYATQLIERLAWATSDAERLESPSDEQHADAQDTDPQHTRQPSRRRATAPSRSRTRPRADHRRVST